MSRWPAVKLGHVLEPAQRPEVVDATREYRLLGVRLESRGPFLREIKTGAETSAKTLFRVRAGDFIYSRLFAWRGAFGVIPPQLDGCCVSNEFPIFVPRDGRVDPQYLKYWFRLPTVLERIAADCTGSTPLTRNRYKEHFFLDLEMPLPPIEGQRRVVEKLNRLASGSARIVGVCAAADAEAAAIVAATSRRLIDLDSWAWFALQDVCCDLIDYRGRTPPVSDSGIPHLTSANIRGGRIDWRTSKYVSEATYRDYMTRGIPQPGDVLFTMEAPLGEAAVLSESRRFSLAQRTLLLRTRPEVLGGDFLAWSLASPRVRESIFSQATGTTVKGIAAKRLKHIRIPVPPLDEQVRICSLLNSLKQLELDDSGRRGTRRALAQSLMSAGLQRVFGRD